MLWRTRAERSAAFAACVCLACAGEPAPSDTSTVRHPPQSNRLAPSAFADLPGAVRRDLEQRGCTIPQSYPDSAAHNVVRGTFTSGAQSDIAVLCLRDSTSSILVYRAATADSVIELAPMPHSRMELTSAGDVFTFSRAVGVADSTFIRTRFERYGGPKPPMLDHEGINDIFVGKASVVWYWHGGRWLQLQGSD